MRTSLSFFFICFAFLCAGQKAPYKFSYQIDNIARIDSDDQRAGVNYSRIGNYKRSLDAFKIMWKYRKISLRQSQKDSFSMYHAEDARQFILAKAKNYRVIIINEAHHIPMHRVFAESLLPGLREEGFDKLGMEALDTDDSTLSSRGYPLMNSGTYVVDPCYGNMIRKALALKFSLFGYDIRYEKAEREIVEVNNIIREIKENPNSKFVIYCGYDHLIKDTMPGSDSWRHAMAGWLRLITGIDPLTIDQTVLTETGEDTIDNPYRALIHADHSVLMIDGNGRSLKPKTRYNADFSVYHPDTKYLHGRPVWQITEDKYSLNINAKVKIGFPCLALVYREGEDYDQAVPTDVIEIKNKEEDIDVILETKHKNVIILKNEQGKAQVIKE